MLLCMHSKELINVDSCRRALRLWKCETKCNCAHISKIAGAMESEICTYTSTARDIQIQMQIRMWLQRIVQIEMRDGTERNERCLQVGCSGSCHRKQTNYPRHMLSDKQTARGIQRGLPGEVARRWWKWESESESKWQWDVRLTEKLVHQLTTAINSRHSAQVVNLILRHQNAKELYYESFVM